MSRLQIMDTTIRDGQQSLWATRMSIGDMLPILPKMDRVGYWAIEAWGGATFDSCLRFLDENPWDRLRSIKATHSEHAAVHALPRPEPGRLQALFPRDREPLHQGVQAQRRRTCSACSTRSTISATWWTPPRRSTNAAVTSRAPSPTPSRPVHTLDSYLGVRRSSSKSSAPTPSAVKDMAGLLTPYRAERMVKALNAEIGLPVHHALPLCRRHGPGQHTSRRPRRACPSSTPHHAPLAFGNSQPAVEMIVAALQESRYDTGLDLDLLFEIAEYWEEVRKRSHYKRGVSSLIHMQVYSHQVPGGMMSNLMSQLEVQNASRPSARGHEGDPARARRGRLSAARHAHVADRGHAGRVQRAHRQALGRRVQGDEGLHLRLLRQGPGAHRPRDHEEGRGQFRRCCSTTCRRRALVTTTYDEVRRRGWRSGPKRRGRAHVRPVPQRGAHLS